MTIQTNHDHPPIPVPELEWSAYDSNTYDADYDYETGRFVSTSPLGHGPTELDAILDLLEQMQDTSRWNVEAADD